MMRLALVVAPGATGPGGAGVASARLRTLLPRIEESFELQLFVPVLRGLAGASGTSLDFAGRDVLPASELAPRQFEHVLYFVENDPAHASMLPMLRRIGGTVVLHDWELGQLALAATPALAKPGLRGQVAAWREGGLAAFLQHRRRGAAATIEDLPLNRSVVRHADAFIVPDEDWRRRILRERNAPTPVAVIPWSRDHEVVAVEESAPRFVECLALLPNHRSNRKSLIRTAIDQADQARASADQSSPT